MKREARLLLATSCSGAWVAAVLRGPQRVEALYVSPSLAELANAVKASRFYQELRYAWPGDLAELLDLPPLEPRRYLGGCLSYIRDYLSSFCRVASVIEAVPGGPS